MRSFCHSLLRIFNAIRCCESQTVPPVPLVPPRNTFDSRSGWARRDIALSPEDRLGDLVVAHAQCVSCQFFAFNPRGCLMPWQNAFSGLSGLHPCKPQFADRRDHKYQYCMYLHWGLTNKCTDVHICIQRYCTSCTKTLYIQHTLPQSMDPETSAARA